MTNYEFSSKLFKKIINVSFPTYSKRKVVVRVAESVTLHDVNWGGGSRNYYTFIRADGLSAPLPVPAPWSHQLEGATIPLTADVICVERSIFCGTEMKLSIYVHPSVLPKWLPAPIDNLA